VKNKELKDHVAARFSILATLTAHLITDGFFCALCAFIGWLLETKVFEPLSVGGFEGWVLWAVRILTGVALIASLAVVILEDIIVSVKQMIKRIKGNDHAHKH
jgi:hypothetical protein